MKWMIKGAVVLSMREKECQPEDLDIVIDGDKIAAVGENLDPEHIGVEKILSGKDKLIIPGLVNAHIHSHDRFDKGRFDNLPLEVWMMLYNPPLGRRNWSPRECYLRTMLNCIEQLKSGTTTVIDDVHHGLPLTPENIEAVFQAYKDMGLRALVSIAYGDKPYYRTIPYLEELLPDHLKTVSGQNCVPDIDRILELWRSFAKKWQGRVQFILSPSAPQRCTDGFLQKTWLLAKEIGQPVVVHVLESRIQAVTGPLFYGKSIIEHMKSLGILTPWTTLVHMVWLTDHEIALVADAGSSIAHNPVCNLKLGSGIARIREMLDAGVNVGLGTDNNNANDTANMFETVKMAALLHKVKHHDYEHWVGAKEALWMATRGGARCGLLHNQIGELAVGKKADMVLLDLGKLSFFPRNNLLHQLVFSEQGESVDTVIVDGKIILKEGRITTIDEQALLNELRSCEQEIKEKISLSSAPGKEIEPYIKQAYLKCVKA